MTPTVFNQQMARLRDNFGGKAFGPAKEELIGKAIRSLPDSSFERICTHMIANFRQAPLPKDFFEAAVKERNVIGWPEDHKAKPADRIQCEWCNDSSVMEIEDRATGKEYFISCGCILGYSSANPLPLWRKEMGDKYKAHRMFGDRALRWKPRQGFNPKDPDGSLEEVVERWKLKMQISKAHWDSLAAPEPDGAA